LIVRGTQDLFVDGTA
jgi:GTPase SAR1 family protein